MADQTRFTTVETGARILRELLLSSEAREVEGETFAFQVYADLSFNDDVGDEPLTLFANRLPPDHIQDSILLTHINGDDVIRTSARTSPDGEDFGIEFTFPLGKTRNEGPEVRVSPEMEAIILSYLELHDRDA